MILPEILSASAQNIIDHHGLSEQVNQLMEECGELISSCNHFLRSRTHGNKAEKFNAELDLKQEISDVIVVLDQVIERIGMTEEELKFMADYKINRELGRIRGRT